MKKIIPLICFLSLFFAFPSSAFAGDLQPFSSFQGILQNDGASDFVQIATGRTSDSAETYKTFLFVYSNTDDWSSSCYITLGKNSLLGYPFSYNAITFNSAIGTASGCTGHTLTRYEYTPTGGWVSSPSSSSNALRHLALSRSLSTIIQSTRNLHWYDSTSYNYGSSYGGLGLVVYLGKYFNANYSMSSYEVPNIDTSTYFLHYNSSELFPDCSYIRVEGSEKCQVNYNDTTPNSQGLICPSSQAYCITPTNVKLLYDLGIPPLDTSPDFSCSHIIKSNYNLLTISSTNFCKTTTNPIIRDIVSPYSPPISFDPDDYDWGSFNWFKDFVVIIVDLVDGVSEWFYDIWLEFLSFLVPNPESLQWLINEVYEVIYKKFEGIDITALSALSDISADMPNITAFYRGATRTLFDFSLIRNNIAQVQPALSAITWLGILIFSYRNVSYILQDESSI